MGDRGAIVTNVLSPEADEDLRCQACGLPLLPLLQVAGNDDKTHGDVTHDDDVCSNVGSASERHRGVMAGGDLLEDGALRAKKKDTKRSTAKPRLGPGVVHAKAVRKVVRQEMIACIPGWNRKRARAVVEAFSNNTFMEITKASPDELNRVLAAAEKTLLEDSELRSGLVKALKRVLQ